MPSYRGTLFRLLPILGILTFGYKLFFDKLPLITYNMPDLVLVLGGNTVTWLLSLSCLLFMKVDKPQ